MQANIATDYSLTYLFGLVAIVVFTTQIEPPIMGIDLRREAKLLADLLGATDEPTAGLESYPDFAGRVSGRRRIRQKIDSLEKQNAFSVFVA